jgi:aldehyde dehydrogenase (NAD+)
VTKVAALPVGDPADPATVIGPLINQRQADTLEALVERGIVEGATAILRGPVKGTLFAPTVLVDLTPDMTIMQEELFGPVACIVPFADDADAVAIANNTRCGLSGVIHTRDLTYGVELARRIATGMIHINDATIYDEPIVAFGGAKHSGLGRLNGVWSLEAFTTLKWMSIHHGRPLFPY